MAEINASAGSFVPQDWFSPRINDQGAMDNDTANSIQSFDTQLDSLRANLVNELCSLRRDVDALLDGGWQFKLGPFERGKTPSDAEEAVLRQQIEARLRRADTPPIGRLYFDGISEAGDIKNDSSLKNGGEVAKDNGTSTPALNSLATQLPFRTKAAVGTESTTAELWKPSAAAASTINEPWKPAFIRSLKPLENLKVPSPASMKSFTRDFLNSVFEGTEHSPSLFYTPKTVAQPILSRRTYYLMNSTIDPYLPASPGQHGAKVTPFFNNKAPEGSKGVSYENVPLFVANSKWLGEGKGKANEYVYFGTYSQTRWSDKLDADRIKETVPLKVKQYWAATLADPARASWMTEALMKHFFPPPAYEGPLPKLDGVENGPDPADAELEGPMAEYLMDLKLHQNFAKEEVDAMTKEDMLSAFDTPDADVPPGLRFWWEYLECVKWDEGFYNMLLHRQGLFNNGDH